MDSIDSFLSSKLYAWRIKWRKLRKALSSWKISIEGFFNALIDGRRSKRYTADLNLIKTPYFHFFDEQFAMALEEFVRGNASYCEIETSVHPTSFKKATAFATSGRNLESIANSSMKVV